MVLKSWQRNVLSVINIVLVGFILFIAAFVLASIVIGNISRLSGVPGKPTFIGVIAYILIVLLISFYVFRSHFTELSKATYLTMPLMVFLVIDGILLKNQSIWYALAVEGLIVLAVLAYLYFKKLSWLYYVSTAYTAGLAIYIMLAGVFI